MPFYPDFITSVHELRSLQRDGRTLVSYSGVAGFNFRGSGGSWHRDTLYIQVGRPWSRRPDDVVASASLASISNSGRAIDAGWAVDTCQWTTMGGRILLQCRLAIRDSDGYINRVAYQVTAIGRP